MIQHLIYDFDGTIADSYPLFMRFLHIIAERHHITIPCDEETLYRAIKRTGYEGYCAMQCEDVLDYTAFMDEFHALQEESRFDFPVFPEAVEVLRAAVAAGKKNYLYTHTGSVVNQMLEHLGIADCFTFVLDASYSFPLKPAPDALQFLTQKFELDPKTCMMIGDRPIDAHAGMAAGMLGCLWDAEALFPDAKVDHYIRDLSEVKRIANI